MKKSILKNQNGCFNFDFAIIFWLGAALGAAVSIFIWEILCWLFESMAIILK